MSTNVAFLQGLWFVLIGVLWAGFFMLEGFDFGVGMLVKLLGKDKTEKRMMIHTIGPVWDGNEVWLLTAGGATFAAFPEWYATVFSGFYLALFLVLAGLIMRGVSFEFWGKVNSEKWRNIWEWTLFIGSFLVALLFGVAFANFIRGVPIIQQPVSILYTGHITGSHAISQVSIQTHYVIKATVWKLLNPYGILGGLMTVTIFLTHGASFLSLKVSGDLQKRASKLATQVGLAATVITAGFMIWTMDLAGWRWTVVVFGALTVLCVAFVALTHVKNEARAFIVNCVGILLMTTTFMCGLFPYAIHSRGGLKGNSLPLNVAASSHYTLTVMTVVAFIFVPIVLGYTGWTYWVFRHRLGRDQYEGPLDPVSVLGSKLSSK